MKACVQTDAELACLLRKGDIRAFDTLYWKYHRAVYRNIIKFTKDNEIADDILQDVFVSLWEKRHEVDPKRSVSGWLFVVSFNKCVNFLRDKLQESEAKDQWQAKRIEEKTLFPEPERTAHLDHLLEQAVATLSPQKQRVFILCKVEGKSYEETARQLNISRHTVKEYLSLAVGSVKNYVSKHAARWEIVLLFLLSTPPLFTLFRIY